MDRTYGDALCSRGWEEAFLQLWQHRLIKRLDPWGAHKDFRGKAGFGPVDQEERGLPGSSAGCGLVPP
jgi:hypothetical protein